MAASSLTDKNSEGEIFHLTIDSFVPKIFSSLKNCKNVLFIGTKILKKGALKDPFCFLFSLSPKTEIVSLAFGNNPKKNKINPAAKAK